MSDGPTPPDSVDKPASDLLSKGADKAIARGLGGWWGQRTDAQQFATALIAGGLAIGPLGLGFLGMIKALYTNAIPSSHQLEAVWWLFLLTGPLAAFCLIIVWTANKHASWPVAGGASALAAVLVSSALSHTTLPSKLGGFYCYAAPGEYDEQCRSFDYAGFVAENGPRANPSGAADVFGAALAYVIDARGVFMALAAIMVFSGFGLLAREAS